VLRRLVLCCSKASRRASRFFARAAASSRDPQRLHERQRRFLTRLQRAGRFCRAKDKRRAQLTWVQPLHPTCIDFSVSVRTQDIGMAWHQALLADGLSMHDSSYDSEDVEDELEEEPELFELGLFWVAPAE